MTDNRFLDDATLDRELTRRYSALRDDLAATLDIEAGLREALIPANHQTLVADLRETLDIEAGLAAIVPEARPVPALHPTDAGLVDGGEPLRFLRGLSLPTRWSLRTAILTGGLEASYRTARELSICVSAVGAEAENVDPSGFYWIDMHAPRFDHLDHHNAACQHAMAAAIALLRESSSPVEAGSFKVLATHWADLEDTVNTTLGNVRMMIKKYECGALAESELLNFVSGRLALDIHHLAQLLAVEINALNNFTEDDLRDQGLEKIHLDGLRWSLATQFPPDWLEEIDRNSVPIGNGVFEVQQGNTRTLV